MVTPLELALGSCLLLGFRHGFDYDHLAAITDITSVQGNWRDSMRLGLLYALGHALTVALLGIAVVSLHLPLPARLDNVGERLVGATLVLLGAFVLFSLLRHRRTHLARGASHHHALPVSRIALLVSGAQWLVWRLRTLVQPGVARPAAFRFRYNAGSVLVVGIIHGLGAETPSQLLLFLVAAHLGGTSRGLIGLAAFLLGLLCMNTIMTGSASGVFAGSLARPRVQAILTSLAAVYSFAVGVIFLFGLSDRLPALTH